MKIKKNIVEQRGHFWWYDEDYPETSFAPEKHVTGLLVIAEDGSSRLELDNVMPSDKHVVERIFDRRRANVRSIQGILKATGQHVLLIDAESNGGNFNSNRFSYDVYASRYCLVGSSAFPRNRKKFTFSRIDIDLAGYEEWLRLGSIQVIRTDRTISVKHRKQKNTSFAFDEGILTFERLTLAPWGKRRLRELTIRESMNLALRFKRSMSPEKVQSEFHFLQDFLIILTDSSFSLTWPEVRLSGSKKTYTIYFMRSVSSEEPPEHYKTPTNFIRLQDDFGKIFCAWREKRQAYGAGFYSYLSTRRDMVIYVENRFLNLALGLESLHRKKYLKPESPTGLEEKVGRILNQISLSKDRKWLEKRLEHAAEPSLEERLFELLRDLPFSLDEDHIRRFAKDCAGCRNDLAHFGGERTRKGNDDFLNYVNARGDALAFFYHMILLREIGIDDEILRWWLTDAFGSFGRKHTLVTVGLLHPDVIKHPTAVSGVSNSIDQTSPASPTS